MATPYLMGYVLHLVIETAVFLLQLLIMKGDNVMGLVKSKKYIKGVFEFSFDFYKYADSGISVIEKVVDENGFLIFFFGINFRKKLFQTGCEDGEVFGGLADVDLRNFSEGRCFVEYFISQNFIFFLIRSKSEAVFRFFSHSKNRNLEFSFAKSGEGDESTGFNIFSSGLEVFSEDSEVLLDAERLAFDNDFILKDQNYFSSLKNIGFSFFSAGLYKSSLRIFEIVAKKSNLLPSGEVYRKSGVCINKLFKRDDKEHAWKRLSSQSGVLLGSALDSLIAGDIEKSIFIFEKESKVIFKSPPYNFSNTEAEKIINAFKVLAGRGGHLEKDKLPEIPSIPKVLVSGMGWSGSGAIYAYLKEFSNVVAVEGESPYIERGESLSSIYSAIDDPALLKEKVFLFFFYSLLGCGVLRGQDDLILFHNARKKFLGEGRDGYIDSIYTWCLIASSMLKESFDIRHEAFFNLSNYTVNAFSVSSEVGEGEVALLDNVLHIGNIPKCLPFLRDVTVLCSFRDPRSNYTSIVRESLNPPPSVDFFVSQRKVGIVRAFESVKKAKAMCEAGCSNSVEVFRFEDFVLSERLRESLSARLGLRSSTQKKYKYFKPWESVVNVFLHQKHEDQDEIEIIEKELGEYCYEPCVRPLLEEV